MSEFAPPAVPDNSVVDPQDPLTTPDIDGLLADFRRWLAESAVPVPAGLAATEEVGLSTLVAQFVALKHEVNLQTKATRTQQQQNADTLQQLGRALESLEERNAATEQAEQEAQEENLRPVLRTFVDLWDALSLAQRETQRLFDSLKPLPESEPLPEPPPPLEPPPVLQASPFTIKGPRSFWGRLFGAGQALVPDETALAAQRQTLDLARKQFSEQQARLEKQHGQLEEQHARLQALVEQQGAARQNEERLRQMLASVLTGYTMSLQRLERAIERHGLEPMDPVGRPFDPETMEVVEVVAQPGATGIVVIGEVRRGYIRRGRVFRYAQVRVAKPG